MKKSIILVLLILALAVPAMAAGDLLVDDADILTQSEERSLLEALENASEQYDIDIVIVTVEDTDGQYIRDYADDYYDYNGYSDDGVLLLIDMDQRKWWITGTGSGTEIFTSSVIDKIGSEFEDALSDGDYARAFETYIEQCSYYIENGPEGSTGGSLIVALIVGLLAAIIATAVMRSQLKSVRYKAAAQDYLVRGSLNITAANEIYLYSNVTKVRRQQSSSGTHHSSSGRSHSGGGGSF